MEMIFNELSIQPNSADKYSANDRMKIFAEAVGEARQKGFNIIRANNSTNQILLTQGYTLYDWFNNNRVSEIQRNFLYGMITPPFISEDDEEIEDQYLASSYYFEDIGNNITKTECLGLASAFLYETLSISFDSLPIWRQTQLQITIENGQSSSTENVFNVYSKSSFNAQDIIDFVESISTLKLVESKINPGDKQIHLTSHHGKKELSELWNKIKKSPYVISGLSIEYGGNSFYKKPQKNGQVDIVHLKSDKRYSLQVQTTGRNFRETIEIAKKLEEEYA